MTRIVLDNINKEQNVITYNFSFSEDLSRYFTGETFLIEYPENIESVPDAVAAVPFVSNILPIMWLTDSELILKELDEAFYRCIPEVKSGYQKMFPEANFAGEIIVDKVIACKQKRSSQKAMFYSGGLDSIQTLISHLDEQPDLISIWGSDVEFHNVKGWKTVHSCIEEASKKYGLKDVVIHSSFREFDCEGELDKDFSEQLQDGWWHGIKHALGLLGHVAPYAYLYEISNMYIASSFPRSAGVVKCASNYLTDNRIRFANCSVIHDGGEFDRQDKVHNIVQYCKDHNTKIKMHVCWRSQTGDNCCKCEKCYRTMLGLIAEMADPEEYGFDEAEKFLSDIRVQAVKSKEEFFRPFRWKVIQARLIQNKKMLRKTKYWKNVKWMLEVDFDKPETLKMSFREHLKQKIRTGKFSLFLHKFKKRIKGSRINQYRIKKQNQISFLKNLILPFGEKIYLLGTPEHANIGDSAIVLAELEFLEECGYSTEQIKEITYNEYMELGKLIKKLIQKHSLLCLHGGGNMGNQWINEEHLRRRIIRDFTSNKLVIFPQTIYYSNTVEGDNEKEESIVYYNDKRILLAARERKSFDVFDELYPNTMKILTPDIVLSTTGDLYNVQKVQRKGALICLREDVERELSQDMHEGILDIVSKEFEQYRSTDMYSEVNINKYNRKLCVQKKMQEFADSELVITDRLHGMVFAALTGTPCIVFSNYNHKVKGTYDWIRYLPYIKYVTSLEEAKQYIPELLQMKNTCYDNRPLESYYNKLTEVIERWH